MKSKRIKQEEALERLQNSKFENSKAARRGESVQEWIVRLAIEEDRLMKKMGIKKDDAQMDLRWEEM
jgi:hypothetical protein